MYTVVVQLTHDLSLRVQMQLTQTQQKKSFVTLDVLHKDRFKRSNLIVTEVVQLTCDLKFEGSNAAAADTVEKKFQNIECLRQIQIYTH